MAGDDAIITSHLDGTRDLCGAVVVVFRLRVPIAALAEEYRSRFGVPKTCTRHWTPCRTKDATPDLVPAGVLMPKPNEGYRSRASTIVHRSVILDMTEFPIYIINLSTSVERWESISGQMDELRLRYERFDAVDGRLLPREVVDKLKHYPSRFRWSYNLCPSEIGCYLSHMSIHKIIVENNMSGAFVLEDDVHIESSFPEVVSSISNTNFKEPTMIKFHIGEKFRGGIDRHRITPDHVLTIPYRFPYSTMGYFINHGAAEKIIQKRHGKRLRRPIDSDIRHRWELGINLYAVTPGTIRSIDKHEESSTIAEERLLYNKRNKIEKYRLKLSNSLFAVLDLIYLATIIAGIRRYEL